MRKETGRGREKRKMKMRNNVIGVSADVKTDWTRHETTPPAGPPHVTDRVLNNLTTPPPGARGSC